MKNYYEVIGVAEDATQEEIKKAYRKLAKEHHPDVNREDDSAGSRFAQINEAYSTLSDERKRREYDRKMGGQGDPFSFSGGGIHINFGDFGFTATKQRRRNSTLRVQVLLTPKELLTGKKQKITFDRIEGCNECGGKGMKDDASCGSCRGRGFTQERITKDIDIPPGLNASPLVLEGEGGREFEGFPPGDVIILPMIEMPDNATAMMNGGIAQTVPLDPIRFLIGGRVQVKTIFDEIVDYNVPEMSNFGLMDAIPNMGLPKELGSKDERDKLILKFVPQRPDKISEEQRELLEQYMNLAEE